MSLSGLRILAVSPVGGYNGHNTSIHRIRALRSLGCHVDTLDSTVYYHNWCTWINHRTRVGLFRLGLSVREADVSGIGPRLVARVSRESYDLIWLERVSAVAAPLLAHVRAMCPATLIAGFSPDDMAGRHNQSQQFLESLPLYDFYLTTKTYNVSELQELGCPRAAFIGNGYDPDAFRPLPLTAEEQRRLGGDIGFIGTYERERAESLGFLAASGLKVRVWGNGWGRVKKRHPNLCIEGQPLFGDDFAKACAAFKVNLGFLRKQNRDLQTTRSVEIPACGGFMLAERTTEHQGLFVEGEEADFFDTHEELLEKCRFYLAHPAVRGGIAERGYRRCVSAGYSNAGRLAAVLPAILSKFNSKARGGRVLA